MSMFTWRVSKVVTFTGVLLVTLFFCSACQKTKPAQNAPAATATGVPSPQTAVQAPTAGGGQLTSFLVDVPGWTAMRAEGMKAGEMGQIMTHAMRMYQKGNKDVAVILMVGNPDEVLASDAELSEGQIETPEVKVEVKTIDGFKVQIAHMKAEGGGSMAVLIKNDKTKGIVLTLTFKGMSFEEALDFAKKFDWNSIKQKAS